MNNEMLTTEDLANRWRVSEVTIKRWRSENKGPNFHKINNRVLYKLEDVIKYEEKNYVKTEEE